MGEVFSQAKKFDVRSIIDSSEVVFSKEIVPAKILEISEISSENSQYFRKKYSGNA